jgi:hypothetical protein
MNLESTREYTKMQARQYNLYPVYKHLTIKITRAFHSTINDSLAYFIPSARLPGAGPAGCG